MCCSVINDPLSFSIFYYIDFLGMSRGVVHLKEERKMNDYEEKIKQIDDKYSKLSVKLIIASVISGILTLAFFITFMINFHEHVYSKAPIFGMAIFSILARFFFKAAYSVSEQSTKQVNALRQEEQIANQNYMQQNRAHAQFVQQEQQRQFNNWAMEENCKSVTPFEMGGYEMNQGNSFNNNNFNNF